ncbi:MAG: slipin family protein [Candidatus Krumholzibacteria bacterium]|nr:slipin family protein [Candidatus Krumholzibacteria bacterium]MDP6797327.1 slipin family protein [Candidatus Krumholzibacteria bacterium]
MGTLSINKDFRFGPINFLALVLMTCLGGALQTSLPHSPDLPLALSTFGVLAGLAMGGSLILASNWLKALILGLAYWLVIHYVYPELNPWALYLGGYLGLLLSTSLQIAKQWEKGVVLRLGKFRTLKGPGFYTILPIIDRVDRLIDHRVRVTDFRAETTLTHDTVPVNVDAIAFWLVWDAQLSVLEVENYEEAVTLSAQTALRDAIGRHDLAQLLSERDRLGQEIQKALDKKTDPWGITIQAIEIRDIIIPKDLEDAMSRQAQAERERQSRVILGTAETEIAEKFAIASESYKGNPVALHLRAMNMVFEGLKQKGSMVIVPSSAVETMGLGALGGLTALGTPREVPEE